MNTPGPYRPGLLAALALVVEVFSWAVFLATWWLLNSEVPAFRFERPEMLRLLFAGPAVVLVFVLHAVWRDRALGRFASTGLLPRAVQGLSPVRGLLRFLLLRHGLAFVVIALAGPQFGTRTEEVRSEGIDVVVALDVSNSMGCEDLRPNRLEAARFALNRLIDQLHGDRLGIVVFAGEAFVQLPITTDRSAAKLFLATIGTHTVGTQGTAIGAAIDLAASSFDPEEGGGRAIIVLTDGENHEDDAEGAAQRAVESGITVHTVGMGTPQGGPIPVRRNGQLAGFRKDRNGNTVVSRLDAPMLERIAAAGQGTFVRATDRSAGIDAILDELRGMEGREIGTHRYTAHADQFQYPLGLGILLMLIGMLLGEQAGGRWPWQRLRDLSAMMALLLLQACGDADARLAARALQDGNTHYHQERFAQADSSYAGAPGDHRAVYNRGNSAHRSAAWNAAVQHFGTAVELADSAVDRARAQYNLGNARRLQARYADSLGQALGRDIAGIRIEGPDIAGKVRLAVHRDSLRQLQQRMLHLTDSALVAGAEAYRKCLRLEPHAEDARHNLTAALTLIAERRSGDDGANTNKDQALSERARQLLAEADELVEQYRFREALELLRSALEKEPSLEQRKDYMDKLDVVTKAAQAK